MSYSALATDYDGTLAKDGRVDPQTWEALDRLQSAGKKLILITGRQLDDLKIVCDRLNIFDVVVAENGALLYIPQTQETRVLGDPPPPEFIETLRSRGVEFEAGEAIVATWKPYEDTVRQTIAEMGLSLEIILNKRAVMVLPAGADKGSGLHAAIAHLNLQPETVVGVGDAENDIHLFEVCGCGVAVANALPAVKEKADRVTVGERGAGVRELIESILGHNSDL